MAGNTLAVRNLFVDRGGRPVLRDVTLTLQSGEITALLGANGAGKSTLVSAIAGVLPVRAGSITVDGKALIGLAPHAVRRLGVALAGEAHPVFSDLSVIDNLRAAAILHDRHVAMREVDHALELFPELLERVHVEARALSGGQKQMVSIAQALISRPRFLLIDELSFGLAPAIVSRLAARVKDIADGGVGVFLIEQFTQLALSVSRRVLVMERGRLTFDGTAQELRARPEVLHGAYLATEDRGEPARSHANHS